MDVVISEKDGTADRWGEDYFKKRTDPTANTSSPGRVQPKRHFLLTKEDGADVIAKTIIAAIASAGNTGTLIFNVGHGVGNTSNLLEGTVELAPGGKLILGAATRSARTSGLVGPTWARPR